MSLANFLLGAKPSGKKRAIDTELDAIFYSQTTEAHRPPSTSSNSPKRSPTNTVSVVLSFRKEKKRDNKRTKIASEPEPEDVAPDAETLETSSSIYASASGSESSDESGEDGGQPLALFHETIHQDQRGKPAGGRENHMLSGQTNENRDARTIFVGNIDPDVAVKRPLQKQLRRHILALVPMAKIESIRFRSVAFNTSTTSKPSEAKSEVKQHKQLRRHERDRASSWRDANSVGEPKKKFLTTSQKKKIAFINRDIHSDASSVHAYIVFAYPPLHSRPSNLPPLPLVMDPFEAARMVVEKCNGTIFLDRILRVDAVVKESALENPTGGTLLSSVAGDPKLSIFVGNLDFASKEEDLRIFFEGVVSAERGPPDDGGLQDLDQAKCWVTRVRVIRDKGTQLGKGFAYVQFSDRTCVDEILALEPGKLKFAKRKLRVQRCRANPKPSSGKNVRVEGPKPALTPNHTPVASVPMGDPSLGERVVDLTKEERKRVKAADADRVARRLAKKKARMTLAKEDAAPRGKHRQRIRKTASKKPGVAAPKKKRIRSETSMARKNMKK